MTKLSIISVKPIGDHYRVSIDTGKNVYAVTTDDGSLSCALDNLIDTVLKKEFGFTKHDLFMHVFELRKAQGLF